MAWNTRPTLVVQLAAAEATILAADATVKRRIREVRVENTNVSGGAAGTFRMAIAAAYADNVALYKDKQVLANSIFKEQFIGEQFVNTAIRAFASAVTTLTAHITYEEEPVS